MNFKEKILFLVFIILVTSIWLTFGERIKKGNGLTVAVVSGNGFKNQSNRFRNVSNYIEYQNYLNALADLEDEKVDAVIIDRLPALNRINQLGEGRLKLAGEQLNNIEGRVVFNLGEDTLCQKFDQALLELIGDGTYKGLSLKYFGVDLLENVNPTPKNKSSRMNEQSWSEIQKKGIIIFGLVFNNPPFCYYDQENNLTGFEVEMANAICKQLKLECHLIDVEWYGAVKGLAENAFDAFWAGANGFESLKGKVVYSEPYYYSGAQLVVKAGSHITGPESLNRSLSVFDFLFRRRAF